MRRNTKLRNRETAKLHTEQSGNKKRNRNRQKERECEGGGNRRALRRWQSKAKAEQSRADPGMAADACRPDAELSSILYLLYSTVDSQSPRAMPSCARVRRTLWLETGVAMGSLLWTPYQLSG